MPNIKVSVETYRQLVELRRGMDNMNSVVKRLLDHWEDFPTTRVNLRTRIGPRTIPPQEEKL